MREKVEIEANIRQEQLNENFKRRNEVIQKERLIEEQTRKQIAQEIVEDGQKQKNKIEKFRKQCADQLDENKKLKDLQLMKELEADNQPPNGTDLMSKLYEQKIHVSYAKRVQNDQLIALMDGQLSSTKTKQKNMQE